MKHFTMNGLYRCGYTELLLLWLQERIEFARKSSLVAKKYCLNRKNRRTQILKMTLSIEASRTLRVGHKTRLYFFCRPSISYFILLLVLCQMKERRTVFLPFVGPNKESLI